MTPQRIFANVLSWQLSKFQAYSDFKNSKHTSELCRAFLVFTLQGGSTKSLGGNSNWPCPQLMIPL